MKRAELRNVPPNCFAKQSGEPLLAPRKGCSFCSSVDILGRLYSRPLRDAAERQLSVADLARTRPHGKGPDDLDPSSVHDHVPLRSHLQQQRPDLAIDQEDARGIAVVLDGNASVGQFRHCDHHGPPAGLFHQRVHQFLSEGVEQESTPALAIAGNVQQSLCPARSVFCLSPSPLLGQMDQVSKPLRRLVFKLPQGRPSLVPFKQGLVADQRFLVLRRTNSAWAWQAT